MIRIPKLKRGSKLGKYKLIKRLGEGTFGEVWKAKDVVEGISVALKFPRPDWTTKEHQKIFQDEVKLVASLDHYNIVKIKTADVIQNRFVVVTKCGLESLGDRMKRRKSLPFVVSVMSQILNALAYAHRHKVIHRDIKPENVILFENGTVRLADFGIAKICERTLIKGEGTGTIGYMAPEQAYGQTTYASDVFSVGVLFYELLTGKLPPWPFEWPYPMHKKLETKLIPGLIRVIRKSTSFNPKKRYLNAIEMEKVWMLALKEWKNKSKKKSRRGRKKESKRLDWRAYKVQSFVRQHRRKLKLRFACRKCQQPISELMRVCPWCGYRDNSFRETTTFPSYCDHCEHGIHNDWRFCPWCFRERFHKVSSKPSRDKRYDAHCTNPRCRKPMITFMRYCPYCHKKVVRPWKHSSLQGRCPHCKWSVTKDFWDFCPWCSKEL